MFGLNTKQKEEKNKIEKKISYKIRTLKGDLEGKKPEIRTVIFDVELNKQEPKNETLPKTKKTVPLKNKPQLNPFETDLKNFKAIPEDVPYDFKKPKNSEVPTALEKVLIQDQKTNPDKNQLTLNEKKQPSIPSFDFNKNQPSVEKTKKINHWLSVVLVMAIAFAASSLAFYYFKVIKSDTTQEIIQDKTPVEMEDKSESNKPVEIQSAIKSITQETGQDLKATLESIFDQAKNDPELDAELSTKGVIYKIQDEQGVTFSAQELLLKLGINLENNYQNELRNGYIFVYYEIRPSNQEKIKKIAFIAETADSTLATKMISNENLMPSLFSGLFLDESPTVEKSTVDFKPSEINPGIRYFNFKERDSSFSIDYGMDASRKYLIVATSKDSGDKALKAIFENLK